MKNLKLVEFDAEAIVEDDVIIYHSDESDSTIITRDESALASNEILYTTSNGEIVELSSWWSGPELLSNTYENGVGRMVFRDVVKDVEEAFDFDEREGDETQLTSVQLSNYVERIGEYAFYHCYYITDMEIPDSVTCTGEGAFQECTSLTSITIGNSVTSIGGDTFVDCSSLTSVTIPDTVKYIDYEAFAYCTSLTNIAIPDSVTSIGNSAFYECTRLTSVTIPDSVTSIGEYAFYDIGMDVLYSVGGKLLCHVSSATTSFNIADGTEAIVGSAFYNCSNLTSVTIPDSVTNIGGYAFNECTRLSSITIPNSVTSIGLEAFSDCANLTRVTIPDSVTSIGNFAFFRCTSLATISFTGTISQWQAITKGEDWHYNVPSTTVVTCTDGTCPM